MKQNFSHNSRSGSQRAFTLIEILIVIGLTTVVFALLLIPLVSALNYTRSAQALTAAQDAARTARERITRELSSALYAFDNTSHSLTVSPDPNVAGEERYTNFLALQVLDNAGNPVVAHAYNAKLDFVLPKVNDNGTAIDPTTKEPITYYKGNGSAVITSPSLVFPAAAGTTMIRYFVGLKDPTKSYNNTHEGQLANGVTYDNIDNTYILYRSQFQPYHVNPATGQVITNADGTSVNEELFAPQGESDGGAIAASALPEFDDPDFFRYVATTDVNWLSKNHHLYTAVEVTRHNARVDKWQQIAKPVIPGPDVDLILLPHDSSGKETYDTGAPGPCTATACPGASHTGIAYDPVGGAYYPIIGTSVTFRPGTVSGNATPATTSDYTSQGVIANTDQSQYTYIPTIYSTSNQSWAKPYKITMTPATAPSGQVSGGQVYTTGLDLATGDLLEYDAGGIAVFDITTGQPEPGKTSYIPLTINADSGTINFAVPAVPDPAAPFQRQWMYAVSAGSTTLDLKTTDSGGHVSPLSVIKDPNDTDASLNPLLTARIVPGSLRVYGPDATAGPGSGQPVLYTEAGNSSAAGDNQYTVDYAQGVLTFSGSDAAAQFTAHPNVTVIYDYQANMAPLGTAGVPATKLSGVTMAPVAAAVDYQTRDLIDVSIGVRLFDISTGLAQIIPSETKVKIGNSNR